jgi:UPF0042 nucleotide-binding protein
MGNNTLLYIITGVSGSGKTTALKALEDIGFYCVDNMPTILIPEFLKIINKHLLSVSNIAIGVDIREEIFLEEFQEIYDKLIKNFSKLHIKVIFLDSNNSTIIKRFKETRRKHPLKLDDLNKAIAIERKKLQFIKDRADIFIDTSNYNVHTLKKFIYNNLSIETANLFTVNLVSFGFKYGILSEADLIFDVRFLNNPYFDDRLKEKTGNEKDVEEYIFQDKRTSVFLEHTLNLLQFLLPEYHKEGKNFIIIGIGCTGGMHRSVVITNSLAKKLENSYNTFVRHRDLNII